jgi:hypothetical protein
MSDLETLLSASITQIELRARVKALTEQVAELAAANAALRARVEGTWQFGEELPALLRRQAE